MKRDLPPDSELEIRTPASYKPRWREALIALGAVLVWTLAWYGSTAKSMVDTWGRSETFTHGFVVPPIVLWLVWRMRDELAATVPRPAPAALALIAAAGALWIAGELAVVNALSHFALTTLVIASVVAVLGADVARKLAFPLGFMYFAVPIGDFMLPQLMEWTADFTVTALRLTGIPVYREGQQFVIPSGSWSVVEACSGLRYLVASLMIGTLFAYLSYRSNKRRLIFCGVAIVVPIVANWLRAYMIVMLGHLSNNKLAAGVDHLIYGWIFFGVVIAIMLGIGARWREDHLPLERPAHASVLARVVGRNPSAAQFWAIALAVIALASVWKLGYWVIERSDASTAPTIAPLAVTAAWSPVSSSPAQWRPHFEKPHAELERVFTNGSQTVGVFIGYYRNQDPNRKLVSSDNALVRTDDPLWVRATGGTREIRFAGEPVTARTAELRGFDGRRMTVWSFYWIDGKLTSNDHLAKAYTALSRVLGRGDDSAVIVLYSPGEQRGPASAALESFVRAAGPSIEASLQQTRGSR